MFSDEVVEPRKFRAFKVISRIENIMVMLLCNTKRFEEKYANYLFIQLGILRKYDQKLYHKIQMFNLTWI